MDEVVSNGFVSRARKVECFVVSRVVICGEVGLKERRLGEANRIGREMIVTRAWLKRAVKA